MHEYVHVPNDLLGKTVELSIYMKKSYNYAKTLQPFIRTGGGNSRKKAYLRNWTSSIFYLDLKYLSVYLGEKEVTSQKQTAIFKHINC